MKRILRVVFPLTCLLFAVVSVRMKISYDDMASLNYYGFPFPWHAWSVVSSMEYIVNPTALLVDFLFYLSGLCCLTLWPRFKSTILRMSQRIVIGLWIAAALSVGVLSIALLESRCGFLHPFAGGMNKIVEYRLHFIFSGFPY